MDPLAFILVEFPIGPCQETLAMKRIDQSVSVSRPEAHTAGKSLRDGPRRRWPGLLALLLLYVLPCFQAAAEEPGRRPRIGLVLSGGGARGAAHVSVLRVLEELDVPVDFIAGTSMGAVVGGLYAAGMSPGEMERLLTSMDWDDLLSDAPPRRDMPFREKVVDDHFLPLTEFGFRRGKLVFPRGVVAGQKLSSVLKKETGRVAMITDFDELRVPFRAIATDLETGEGVVLKGGSLPEAIRASMAIPAAFSPVESEGRILVDGGVWRNLPIDVVRRMGADVVIAVDISTPLASRERLVSAHGIYGQLIGFLTARNVEEQLRSLREGDILIRPDLHGITTLDFKRVGEAMRRGLAAAEASRAALSRLSVSPEEYCLILERLHRETPLPQIAAIRLGEVAPVDHRIVERLVQSRPGPGLTLEGIQRDLARIRALGDYELVKARPEFSGDAATLVIDGQAKRWGPNFVRLGLDLATDFSGESNFGILLEYRSTRLNALGLEWRTLARTGTDLTLLSELYQPLDWGGRFFASPVVFYRRTRLPLFVNERRVADYTVDQPGIGLEGGISLGSKGQLNAGLIRTRVHGNPRIAGEEFPEATLDRTVLHLRGSFDQLDSSTFPRHGAAAAASFEVATRSLGGDAVFRRASLSSTLPSAAGRSALVMSARGGTSLGTDLPIDVQFTLGGFNNLSGFQPGQLRGESFVFGGLEYNYRIGGGSSFIRGLYAGATLEAGNAWPLHAPRTLSDLRPAGSIFLAANTLIGPIHFGLGMGDGGNRSVFFTVGGIRR